MPKLESLLTENATFQVLSALKHNRSKRRKQRSFLVEGVRLINELYKSSWHVKALLYTGDKPLSNWAQDILKRDRADIHYELSTELMAKLSAKNQASELLCLVEMKDLSFETLASAHTDAPPLIVVCDRLSNPGNLGTIIRSCDAFGASGLIVTGHAADLYDPKTLAATAGSFFAVPSLWLESHKDVLPFLEQLREKYGRVQVIGSSAQASTTLYDLDYRGASIFLIGNEEKGLSQSYQSLATQSVTIPMMSKAATSLNAAVAASIMLAEARRQKGGAVSRKKPFRFQGLESKS